MSLLLCFCLLGSAPLLMTGCEPFGALDAQDIDDDGIDDWDDNCPAVSNYDQDDEDSNGTGDACEGPDGDQDGVPDGIDNCPSLFNEGQGDFDSDGVGDACDDDQPDYARYVLIEDLSQNVSGGSPGADIDAVALVKSSGAVYWATTTEDFTIGGGMNEHTSPDEATGEPNSECQVKNFVALGGANENGMLIVSFTSDENNVTIENGDRVRVIEVGETECSGRFEDDPYSVSISGGLDSYVEIGRGSGTTEMTVFGL